uniref:U2A'/phosphoprotein 32 family A C-terminal domain-containing protein n=1 Tax=Strigamia maritima TaxID=126957 RepID=T1IIB4_STRMM
MGHHSEQPFEQNSNNYDQLPRVPLTIDIIKNLSGQQNVISMRQIQMQLDINRYSIQNLGYLLPFLMELNISSSSLDSLRDLGTCLQNLKILRVSNCRLENLDGAMSLISLVELEARDNYIDDLYNCAFLHNLETLDVENNNIADIHNLSFLSICNGLQTLTLRHNPVAEKTNYREDVWSKVPNLKILDDVVLTKQTVDNCNSGNINFEYATPQTQSQLKYAEEQSRAISKQTETEEVQARQLQEKAKLKKKKLQRRPTLSDLLHNQSHIDNFWLRPDNKPNFLRRRRTNSMVDEILFPLENDDFKNDCKLLSKKTNSPLTKQNSMPEYPEWFDPHLSIAKNEPNISENQPSTSKTNNLDNSFLKDTPLTYVFKSNTCLVVDAFAEDKVDSESHNDKLVNNSISTLMSTIKFPKPVQKGDSLDFTENDLE